MRVLVAPTDLWGPGEKINYLVTHWKRRCETAIDADLALLYMSKRLNRKRRADKQQGERYDMA